MSAQASTSTTSVLKAWCPICYKRQAMGVQSNKTTLLQVRRRCLVCDYEIVTEEAVDTPVFEVPCEDCGAPTERLEVLRRRSAAIARNPHAAALGRLGGLKGGPARAANLSAMRRREIARTAAHARWFSRVAPVKSQSSHVVSDDETRGNRSRVERGAAEMARRTTPSDR